MTKTLLLLFPLLLSAQSLPSSARWPGSGTFPRPISAAPGPAYSTSAISSVLATAGGTTYSVPAINVPAGATIWFMVGNHGSGCGTFSMTATGTGAESFTQIGSNASQSFICSAQFYKTSSTGNASYVITAVDSGAAFAGLSFAVVVVTGVTTLHDSQSGFAGSGASVSTSSPVGASASAIAVAGVFDYYPTDTITAGGGLTQTDTAAAGGGKAAQGYQLISSGTTLSFNVSGSTYVQILAASFQ